MHGEPLELSDVSVLGLSDGTFTLTAFTPGLEVTLGPMAHIMVRRDRQPGIATNRAYSVQNSADLLRTEV